MLLHDFLLRTLFLYEHSRSVCFNMKLHQIFHVINFCVLIKLVLFLVSLQNKLPSVLNVLMLRQQSNCLKDAIIVAQMILRPSNSKTFSNPSKRRFLGFAPRMNSSRGISKRDLSPSAAVTEV